MVCQQKDRAAEFYGINRRVQFQIWEAEDSIFHSLSAFPAQKFNFPPGYSQPDAQTDVRVPDRLPLSSRDMPVVIASFRLTLSSQW